jgi:hypothetical protein
MSRYNGTTCYSIWYLLQFLTGRNLKRNFRGGKGAIEVDCPPSAPRLFSTAKTKGVERAVAPPQNGFIESRGTNRHKPAQTGTNRHKPTQTGTNRHKPAQIFVPPQDWSGGKLTSIVKMLPLLLSPKLTQNIKHLAPHCCYTVTNVQSRSNIEKIPALNSMRSSCPLAKDHPDHPPLDHHCTAPPPQSPRPTTVKVNWTQMLRQ